MKAFVGGLRSWLGVVLIGLGACAEETGSLADLQLESMLTLELTHPAYLVDAREDRALIVAAAETELWFLDFETGAIEQVTLSRPSPGFGSLPASFVGEAVFYADGNVRHMWVPGRAPIPLAEGPTPFVPFDDGVLFLNEVGTPVWMNDRGNVESLDLRLDFVPVLLGSAIRPSDYALMFEFDGVSGHRNARLFHAPSQVVSWLPGRNRARQAPPVHPRGVLWSGELHTLGASQEFMELSPRSSVELGRDVVCAGDDIGLTRHDWDLDQPPLEAVSPGPIDAAHAVGEWCLFRPRDREDVLLALGPSGELETFVGRVSVETRRSPPTTELVRVADVIFNRRGRFDLSELGVEPAEWVRFHHLRDGDFLFVDDRSYRFGPADDFDRVDCDATRGVVPQARLGRDGRWCLRSASTPIGLVQVSDLLSGDVVFERAANLQSDPVRGRIDFPPRLSQVEVGGGRAYLFEWLEFGESVRLEVVQLPEPRSGAGLSP